MSRSRPRLFWILAASFVGVVALCTVSLGWYAIRSAHGFYLENTQAELERRVRLVESQLGASLTTRDQGELQALMEDLGRASATRYTIVGPTGEVLADSRANPSSMANHGDRPEVRRALQGAVGVATRASTTLGVRETYVALPYREHGKVVAAVRAAVPLTEVEGALRSLYRRVAISATLIAALGVALGVLFSRRLGRRVRLIADGAGRLASGDFQHRLEVSRTREFGLLAESINTMAEQLDNKIRTISDQRNEREAILRSMVEGVLAVDTDERVITMNRAAARLLGVNPLPGGHPSIQEVVRNPELQQLLARALREVKPIEAEVVLHTARRDRYLQVSATALRDVEGIDMGAIAVLNDVTALQAVERMRREFVADVSHEIKTPVTAIKGFAETLLDGALDDRRAAERFLRIVVQQADRLNSIVEDLLALSSVEQAEEHGTVELQESRLSDVLQVAVEVCWGKAVARNISLRLRSDEDLWAGIDPLLLERAVVNLIDNAIKYSPSGTSVEVAQAVEGGEIVISVRDEGPGIAAEHLPRVFERFYRIDKARSRDLGGTGLGLSIVKHIAEAHHGRTSVESLPGVGSTFRIHLPPSVGTPLAS